MPHTEVADTPSVTQIINIIDKPFLLRWYASKGWDECERIKKEAAELGTFVHDAITRYIKQEAPLISTAARANAMVSQFIEWHRDIKLEPLVIEPKQPLESVKYHFQGTPDCIGIFNGRVTVLDWKTSSRMSLTNGLQLAAYAYLYSEVYKVSMPTLGVIVRLDEDRNSPEIKRYEPLSKYFRVFLAAKKVFDYMRQS